MSRYNRVLIKLSGAAISGNQDFGFEHEMLEHVSNEIISLKNMGIEVAVVIGGGNIFRGNMADNWGIERAEADNIGMMATIINSLFLRGVLSSKDIGEVRVMTSVPMNAIAEPYIRLRADQHLKKGHIVIFAGGTGQPFVTTDYACVQRALETNCDAILVAKDGTNGVYDKDPRHFNDARMYETISYTDAINKNLKVMDQSAFILSKEYDMPIHIFDFSQKGTMRNICDGENIGTLIQNNIETKFK